MKSDELFYLIKTRLMGEDSDYRILTITIVKNDLTPISTHPFMQLMNGIIDSKKYGKLYVEYSVGIKDRILSINPEYFKVDDDGNIFSHMITGRVVFMVSMEHCIVSYGEEEQS